MIEYITLIILVLALIIGAYLFLGSFAVFVINIIVIGILVARINYDIKKEGIFYYFIAAFVTVFLLTFQSIQPFKLVFYIFEKALLINISSALILVFLIAYLIRILETLLKELLNRDKK